MGLPRAPTVVATVALGGVNTRPAPFGGDVNDDGQPDLIVASLWEGTLRAFFGPLAAVLR